MPARKGFTLVELLVVIAIIGVLVALLLPAISHSREATRRSQCASNMRQVGLAIHGYAGVNHGNFPKNWHAGQLKGWMYTVMPFAEGNDLIRMCPNDPKREERLADPNKGASYVMNEYVSTDNTDPKTIPVPGSILSLYKLPETTKVIVIFEGADDRSSSSDHAHCSTWYHPLYTADETWSNVCKEIHPTRHDSMSNYLYADGHVDTIAEPDFYSRIMQDMQRGTNSFMPKKN